MDTFLLLSYATISSLQYLHELFFSTPEPWETYKPSILRFVGKCPPRKKNLNIASDRSDAEKPEQEVKKTVLWAGRELRSTWNRWTSNYRLLPNSSINKFRKMQQELPKGRVLVQVRPPSECRPTPAPYWILYFVSGLCSEIRLNRDSF